MNINLADYDKYGNFNTSWRVRLDMFRVVLLDEFDKPIPSPGRSGTSGTSGGHIQIRITYPTIFKDTNLAGKKLSFLAQKFYCSADYYTVGEGNSFARRGD